MNFQKSFITLSIVLSSLLTTSCVYVEGTVGEGRIVSELCDVGEFTAVALHSSAEVEISTGEEFSVVLSDYENLISWYSR